MLIYTATPARIVQYGMNVLVYGNQGSGKTHFAAQAQDHPEMRDVLVLNVEGGMMTLAGRGDISVVDIRSMEQLEDVQRAFQSKSDEVQRFRTVVLDSITELQRINLEAIASSRARGNPDEIQKQYYNTSALQIGRILRFFRDLPVNFIVTALTREEREGGEDGKVIGIVPALTFAARQYLTQYMDAVWYLYTKEGEDGLEYKMVTREHNLVKAKTRGLVFGQRLDTVMNNIGIQKLFDLYIESETAEAERRKAV